MVRRADEHEYRRHESDVGVLWRAPPSEARLVRAGTVILVGAVYLVVGIIFGALAGFGGVPSGGSHVAAGGLGDQRRRLRGARLARALPPEDPPADNPLARIRGGRPGSLRPGGRGEDPRTRDRLRQPAPAHLRPRRVAGAGRPAGLCRGSCSSGRPCFHAAARLVQVAPRKDANPCPTAKSATWRSRPTTWTRRLRSTRRCSPGRAACAATATAPSMTRRVPLAAPGSRDGHRRAKPASSRTSWSIASTRRSRKWRRPAAGWRRR